MPDMKHNAPGACTRRIAIFLPQEQYGREIFLGIARYAREQGFWTLYSPQGGMLPILDNLTSWRGDGIIAFIEPKTDIEAILRTGLPLVNVSGRSDAHPATQVIPDNHLAGEIAALHLLERGLTHFGFVSYAGHLYAQHRWEGFLRTIRRRGGKASLIAQGSSAGWSWPAQQEELRQWLARLPRPCGVAACNDLRAQHVISAAREVGIRMPEEMAVIGFDNDAVTCEISDPTLTSVALNPEKVGYLAASVLDRMMQGKRPQRKRFLVRPSGVVVRRSTEVFAVGDPDVAEAMRLIRQHAFQRVSVDDVCGTLAISRRTLERRFQRILGRTVFEDIRMVQLDRAKQLLIETDWPVYRVAQQAGFNDSKHLALEFAHHVGLSPVQFRLQRGGL